MPIDPSRTRRLLILSASVTFFITTTVIADIRLTEPPDADQWVNPDTRISFRLSDDSRPRGVPAIFIGKTDVTALFDESGPGEYTYTTASIPLPNGESELIVYDQKGGEWTEIARSPIRVLTRSGFEAVEVSPRFDINIDSQWDEGHSEDAGEPERLTFHDGAMQAGFSGVTSRRDLSLNSSLNLSGASEREQALRFGEKGEEASKIDLADYFIEVNKGNTSLSVGHVSYGEHPLLVSSIANRGVTLKHKLSDYFDVSLALQNGTSIVGFTNALGLKSMDHNIASANVGYEILPKRPGGLRVELGYVTARIQSENNFDVGEVPDAEKSNGWGVRLLGANESGRLRGELNFARADYTNPEDALLSQDLDIVEVKETSNDAQQASLSYDLLKDMMLGENTPFTLTATIAHERTDPLYKTLTAFPNADTLQNQAILAAQIGQAAIELQHVRSEDNLDDIASILKTETRNTMLNASFPLGAWFSDPEQPHPGWPTLSLTGARIHQFAVNNPDGEISDFNGGSHVPDQVNVEANLGLNWGFERWDGGYNLSSSDQDNRQVGREEADFKRLGHELSLGYRATDNLQLGFSLGRVRNSNEAEQIRNFTENGGINLTWQIAEKWALTGNLAKTLDTDSEDNAENDNENADLQLSHQFVIPFPGGYKRNGQFFVRYNTQRNDSQDRLFEVNSLVNNWTFTSGLSFSLF